MKVTFHRSSAIDKSITNAKSYLTDLKAALADLETEEKYSPLDDGDKLFKAELVDNIAFLKQRMAFRRGLEKITLNNDIYELYASHNDEKFYIFNNDSWFGVWFNSKEAKQLCNNLSFIPPLELPGVAAHYKTEYKKMNNFHKTVEAFSAKPNRAQLDDDTLSSLLDHWSGQRGNWLTIDYKLVGLQKGAF